MRVEWLELHSWKEKSTALIPEKMYYENRDSNFHCDMNVTHPTEALWISKIGRAHV